MSEKEFVINKLKEGLSPNEILKSTPENLSQISVKSYLKVYPSKGMLKKLGKVPRVLLGLFVYPHFSLLALLLFGLALGGSQKPLFIGEIFKTIGGLGLAWFLCYRYLLDGHRVAFRFGIIVGLVQTFSMFGYLSMATSGNSLMKFLIYSGFGCASLTLLLSTYTLFFVWKKPKFD